MWINAQGALYVGDMAAGDRAATDAEVAAWNAANAPTFRDRRRAEYPPISEQLDAMWKGGAEADAMKATIDAIKLKYPNPAPTGGK